MANGPSTSNGDHLGADLRVRAEEESSFVPVAEGTLAPASQVVASPERTRARDDPALIDALGSWLDDELNAQLQQDADNLAREREAVAAYRHVWQEAEEAILAQRHDMQWQLEARERVIKLLLATCYRMEIRRDVDATFDGQLEICASYVDELVTFARQNNTRTILERPARIRDDTYNTVIIEQLGEETETDSEMDIDEEMEEL